MRANLTILELICPTLLSIIKQNAENSATSVSPTTNAIIYDSKLLQTPNCVRLLELAKLAKKKNLFKNNNDSKSPSVNWDFSTKNQKTAHPLENAMNQLNSINETLGQNVISNIKSRSERKVDSSDDEDACYPPHIRIIMSLIFFVLSFIGIVGNILVVVVVKKVPGMITPTNPTNCYLVSLAISDCLFFVAAAPTELSYLHVPCSDYFFGDIGCSVFTYLPYLAINSSSMSITAFTIERFLAICYPLKSRYICSVKRAKTIILFIWIFCIFYNSPWLYLAALKMDENGRYCGFRNDRDDWKYKVMFLVDFVFWYLIPMIMYVFIYAKISYTLSKSPLWQMRSSYQDTSGTRNECSNKKKLPKSVLRSTDSRERNYCLVNNNRTVKRNDSKKIQVMVIKGHGQSHQVKVIKMLAVVVFVFAICWLPYRAMVMYNSFVTSISDTWDPDWFIFMSKTMIFINCAVNPILYNLMSERFRSAFRRLLNKNKYIDEFRRNSAGQPSSKTTGGHIIRQQTLINKQISFEEQTVLDAETCPMKFLNEKKVDSEDARNQQEVSTCLTLLLSENGGVRELRQSIICSDE